MLTRRMIILGVTLVTLCGTSQSSASIIVASGAGSTLATAENLTGLYPNEIVGTLDGTNQNAVSIFKIMNLQPSLFSAFTVDTGAFGIPDTVLSLFSSTGLGIYLSDDISGSNTFSCIPSPALVSPCQTVGATLPIGVYYLAISRSANYPLDTLGNEIFNPVSSTDLVGPSSTLPLGSWDGGAYTSPYFDQVNYQIDLTGTAPEPATWLLTASAGLICLLWRRRSAVN